MAGNPKNAHGNGNGYGRGRAKKELGITVVPGGNFRGQGGLRNPGRGGGKNRGGGGGGHPNPFAAAAAKKTAKRTAEAPGSAETLPKKRRKAIPAFEPEVTCNPIDGKYTNPNDEN